MKSSSILLIDPNIICRSAIQQLIEGQTPFRISGQAGDLRLGIKLLAELKPDAVIVDAMVGPMSALNLIKTLRKAFPPVRIVVFSAVADRKVTRRMINAGAQAVIPRSTIAPDFIEVVRKVLEAPLRGPAHLSDGNASFIVTGDYKDMHAIDSLSRRESEVFRAIGRGQSTRQIAEALNLSIKTIESYRAHIKEKLRLENNLALLRAAIQSSEES